MIEYPRYTRLPDEYLKVKLNQFLKEDAPNGDLTSMLTIPDEANSTALIINEENAVFAGQQIIKASFWDDCLMEINVNDGDFIPKGNVISKIIGKSKYILLRERVVLNLLQRLCAIATETRKYVEKANPYNVKILDTRKTTPGLRLFEKYAVACGGGYNHRLDLSSGILIKDNHIKAAGSVSNALNMIKSHNPQFKIEIEVETTEQIREAMEFGVDGFLLDNMTPEKLLKAVELIRSYPKGEDIFIEASGGITLDNIDAYLNTGINAISVGALTHSIKSIKIHMEFE